MAKILSAASGKDLATLQIGARPDAVLYDGTRKLAYIPSAMTGTLAVIALSGPHDNAIIDTVTTQLGARTGAVDEKTGQDIPARRAIRSAGSRRSKTDHQAGDLSGLGA